MIRRIIVGSALAATGWAAWSNVQRWRSTWGFDPAEAGRELPGDDLVPDATAVETRGISIDAPVSAVWPWLLQMGYGRAGWYSYDALDMRGSSSDRVRDELQHLDVGDTVPTDPDGGFVVKVVDPERALVLYVDPEIIAARRPAGALDEVVTPGVAVSGRFLATATPPKFSAAWAFVLEPVDGGRTRLIERFRARLETSSPGSTFLGPMLGFGMFLMTRRQLLGIKVRAEKLATDRRLLHRDVDEIVERAMEEREATTATEPLAATT
jgi:hypothetical protein